LLRRRHQVDILLQRLIDDLLPPINESKKKKYVFEEKQWRRKYLVNNDCSCKGLSPAPQSSSGSSNCKNNNINNNNNNNGSGNNTMVQNSLMSPGMKNTSLSKLDKFLSLSDRLELCSAHFPN
jgi:hypothetical protein